MPLFVKIDFRADGKLGAWWTRDENAWHKTTTQIGETRVRDVLIALADEIDPEEEQPSPKETK